MGFVAIPVILNWVLRWNAGCRVISDPNSSPGVWLFFWGDYLAAIGTAIMAYISYTQNRSAEKNYQNTQAMQIARWEYESEKAIYDSLERFVLENENIHSNLNINRVLLLTEQVGKMDNNFTSIDFVIGLREKLSEASLKNRRYANTPIYKEYYDVIKELNMKMIEVFDIINDFLNSQTIDKDNNFYKYIVNQTKESDIKYMSKVCEFALLYLRGLSTESLYSKLMREGARLLERQAVIVDDKFNDLKNISK